MLVKLQAALTAARGAGRPVAPVSACVGDTKNGVASPAGVQAAPAGSALIYDMGTYSSSTLAFERELVAALEVRALRLGTLKTHRQRHRHRYRHRHRHRHRHKHRHRHSEHRTHGT